MKNGSGFLILLAMYHSICWSYILIAKLLVIGYTKHILNSIITMKDFQRFCGTSFLIKVFTFQSKPYVHVFSRRYNISKRKPLTIFDIRKLIYWQSNALSFNFVYCVFLILMLTLHLASGLPLYSFHISIYAKASWGTK